MANFYQEPNVDLSNCGSDVPIDPSLLLASPVNAKCTESVRVEQRTILQTAAPCCDTGGTTTGGTVNEQSVPLSIVGDDCIEIIEFGENSFQLLFRNCAAQTFNYSSCGIEIENGYVKAFAKPVLQITSSDASLSISNNGRPDANCAVDLKVDYKSAALPVLVLCESGACQEAGSAMGIVQVLQLSPGQFSLSGCALAGQGANGASLSYDSTTIFPTIAAAVVAMNAANLTASFGSCGGNGV